MDLEARTQRFDPIVGSGIGGQCGGRYPTHDRIPVAPHVFDQLETVNVRHAEIRRLALGLRDAARALKANRAQLQTIVNDLVPGLTEQRGIGPVSAAQAIVSFSHPGRCRNDAAFAALGGASPLPASSGRTVRHRLNRGGDRALNRALHTIALTRMRSCPTTQAYVARRTAQGKNPKEIRRCLKRYIARQLYRTLTTAMTPATEVS